MTTRFDRHALRIVDAAYGLERTTEGWMDTVLQSALPALDQGLGLVGIRFRITDAGTVQYVGEPQSIGPTPPGLGEELRQASEALPVEVVRDTYAHHYAYDTSSGGYSRIAPEADLEGWEVMAVARTLGVRDTLVAKMIDANRNGILLTAAMPTVRFADREQEPRWRLVMAHLLAGLRLRQALGEGDGEAVLHADGRVVHAESDARSSAARDALRRAAVAIDRARSSAGARDPDAALRAWQGLVEGRWSLVDRFDSDGRRFLVARRNDPLVPAPRALSERERQIAAYAGLGHSNKRIAYTLGLAPSTVSSHLQAAMRRLGARDPAALADLFFTPPVEDDENGPS